MEKIAVLFPSSDEFFVMPSLRWVAEYYACMWSEVFEPVLFWQRGFMDLGELALERPAKTKTQWCILRCDPVGSRRFEGLRHALARNGYRLAFHDGWCDHYRTSHDNSLSTLLRPETVIPYQSGGDSHGSGRGGWLPGGDSYRGRLPMVVRDESGILNDKDGNPFVLRDVPDDELLDMICEWFRRHPGSGADGLSRRRRMWFEQYIDPRMVGGSPVVWRAFSYMGRVFHLSPKFHKDHVDIPRPPEDVLKEVTSLSFDYSDLVLSWDGRWWEVECGNAQYAPIPDHARPMEFYELLEREVLRGPDMPEWTWCLVGNIVQTHESGDSHRVLQGTRHFRPGTKVYVADAFWGQGGERVCAIGVPRYCGHLVGVHMDSALIENYRLERVCDREVLRALFTNRLREDFEICGRTSLRTCWGNDDRSRRDIETYARCRNGA